MHTCSQEIPGLVAQMKQHHEKCSFPGGTCFENNEWNMSEHAGSPGGSILIVQDSDYPSSTSLSLSSGSDDIYTSVPVKCMSPSISLTAKRKNSLHHSETTTEEFVIRTSRLQQEVIDEKTLSLFMQQTLRSIWLRTHTSLTWFGHSDQSTQESRRSRQIAGKLLDKVYEKEIEHYAKSLEGKLVNLSLGGLGNVHNDPVIYACVTTKEGTVYFKETIDTSGNAHIAEQLQEVAVNL